MKFRLVGTKLFHVVGRKGEKTDRYDSANSSFPKFGESV